MSVRKCQLLMAEIEWTHGGSDPGHWFKLSQQGGTSASVPWCFQPPKEELAEKNNGNSIGKQRTQPLSRW